MVKAPCDTRRPRDDVMMLTIGDDLAARKRFYELLADALGLETPA
jgi:hypothetical protein